MIRIDSEKRISVVEIGGRPTIWDLQACVRQLIEHPDHLDGMDEIWDFRQADLSSLSLADLGSMAAFVKQYLSRLGRRTALVAHKNWEIGIGRMWVVCAEYEAPQQRRVFRKLESAYEWLAS